MTRKLAHELHEMTKLTEDVKCLIVTQLAQFRGYAETARLVTEETGVIVDRFQVRTYDPTKSAYAGSDKWREAFNKARLHYLKSVEDIPIAHKAYRLNELQRIHDEAQKRGNLVLACATLKQAAKEVGNLLVSDRDVRLNNSTNSLSDLTSDERRAMAGEILRNAIGRHAQKVGSSIN